MSTRNATIVTATITAVATIVVALIQFHPWSKQDPQRPLYVAGTVVDVGTNRAVPQALVTVSGRTESYVTEDNGNFRLDFTAREKDIPHLRIRVVKDGYKTYDASVSPPTGDLIVQLQKLKP